MTTMPSRFPTVALSTALVVLSMAPACTKATKTSAAPRPERVTATALRPLPAPTPPAPSVLPSHGTRAEAAAMLAKVVAHMKAVGREQAFADFTARRAPFYEKDMYTVCTDSHGVVVAHGGFPTYVGSSAFFKDVDGRLMAPIIRDAATTGSGTVRYTIKSDETNGVAEAKLTLAKRIKNDVCGVVLHDAGTIDASTD